MKNRILPPTYFILLLVLTIISHYVLPIKKIIYFPYNLLGVVLILFGIVLNIWADNMFKKRKTTVKPHEIPEYLEISGPFKISRHPMYLGMAAILLGTAVILGSLISFLFFIIFIIFMEALFVPVEEKNLEKAFGKKYSDYKKKVRRWV